eukprot:gene10892-7552_t
MFQNQFSSLTINFSLRNDADYKFHLFSDFTPSFCSKLIIIKQKLITFIKEEGNHNNRAYPRLDSHKPNYFPIFFLIFGESGGKYENFSLKKIVRLCPSGLQGLFFVILSFHAAFCFILEFLMKRGRLSELSPVVSDALKKFQNGLNNRIDEDWQKVRKLDDWVLAITMESAELIDSYPWKWWKNINAPPDIPNVKVEIVDIFHFSLSGGMQSKNYPPSDPNKSINLICPSETPQDVFQDFLFLPMTSTANAVATMRNIIQLAQAYKFDLITEGLFVAAADLGLNLVAFYVAKHTLNNIRQLNGYKAGSYIKVQKGVEDNALLHDCIKHVDIEKSVDPEKFRIVWDEIIENVYEAFNWLDEVKEISSKLTVIEARYYFLFMLPLELDIFVRT